MRITRMNIRNLKSYEDSGTLEFGPINVIVGRNNSGKSVLLRGIHLIQTGSLFQPSDARFRQNTVQVDLELEDVDVLKYWPDSRSSLSGWGNAEIVISGINPQTYAGPTVTLAVGQESIAPGQIANKEPSNLIYPFLAKRKVTAFDQVVDAGKTSAITSNLQNLVSKVQRISTVGHPSEPEYTDLCQQVLGFRVTTHASPGGQQAGIHVGKFDYIPIENMGDGIPHLLGLVTDLCIADGNVFLIEELENDIHPEGLKALLRVIVEKSVNNQFFVSTHSNIVLRWLGGAPGARVFLTSLESGPGEVPSSVVTEVPATAHARGEILTQLGYELQDFDLWDGWLFLEESSAERLIRDQLVPLFAPGLSRLRTIAVGGTSKAEPTFEDFNRLFRFTHLEERYRNRAWVMLDGDAPGRDAIAGLQARYRDWQPAQFGTWGAEDFEAYYPTHFKDQAKAALALKGDSKRNAKRELLNEVLGWCKKTDEGTRRASFEASAHEVIEVLRKIEDALAKIGGGTV